MPYLETFDRRHLFTLAKIVVSLAAIAIIATKFNLVVFLSYWHKLSISTILASLLVLAFETSVLAGLRLKLVLLGLGSKQRLVQTSQIALCGFFLEQVAFGFVGGDAMRLWLLHRLGIPLGTALEALVIDRCLGLLALALLVLTGLPSFLDLAPGFTPLIVSAAVVGILGVLAVVALFLMLGRTRHRAHPVYIRVAELLTATMQNRVTRNSFLLILVLATLTHIINILVFVMVGRDLAMPLTLLQWWSIIPPALLFSMIPISAGGWGLRESVLVFALGRLGISAEEAIVPSLIFGLGVLLVTLPGLIVWLAYRKPAAGDEPLK
jgi:hypothetical protein